MLGDIVLRALLHAIFFARIFPTVEIYINKLQSFLQLEIWCRISTHLFDDIASLSSSISFLFGTRTTIDLLLRHYSISTSQKYYFRQFFRLSSRSRGDDWFAPNLGSANLWNPYTRWLSVLMNLPVPTSFLSMASPPPSTGTASDSGRFFVLSIMGEYRIWFYYKYWNVISKTQLRQLSLTIGRLHIVKLQRQESPYFYGWPRAHRHNAEISQRSPLFYRSPESIIFACSTKTKV